jgi:integrase
MPNRITFTQLAIDKLRPPPAGRVVYWDKMLPGFGLRVSAPRPGSREGRKTWIAMYRAWKTDDKGVYRSMPVMEAIGTLAQVPKVDKARELARASLLRAKAGINPVEERRTEKARRGADAVAAEAAAREAVEGQFGAVAERFLMERGQTQGWSPKYAAEVRRILLHDVLPKWGKRPIREITDDDVKALLWAKAAKRERARKGTEGGAAKQANRTLTRLSTLFRWAMKKKLITIDPTVGIDPLVKEKARDRTLCGDEEGHRNDDELIWFWRGAERAGWPYGAIFRLLLLTAQREAEVAGMRWSEVDLENGIWVLPAARTKSDREHIVHLSQPARDILATVPRLDGDIVFPSRADGPVASFSKPKQRLDAAMTAQTGDPQAQIEPWVLHDLRRTAATLMVRLGVVSDVADRVLNHAAGNRKGTVKDVYGRHEFLKERRAALEALGRFVEGLVRPGGGNVVELRRA